MKDMVIFVNYDDGSKDLYSSYGKRSALHNYDDIYSDSGQRRNASSRYVKNNKSGKKTKKRRGQAIALTAVILVCCILLSLGGLYLYAYRTIDKIEREPLNTADLGITSDKYDSVKNIALLGLDTRQDNDTGRSDAVVILTVDKKNKKIKLTSVARDTYVAIDGRGQDKLTHAYAYGKSQLAVKTLNENFGTEITDYVTFNFFGMSRVIDCIGGVTIDVTEKERVEMNSNIFPEMRSLGIDCPDIENAGTQVLNGGQAVCYARIRHTDNDVQRGNRQKTVLTAMFAKVKKTNPVKLPKIAQTVVSDCKTSLSTNDIMNIGIWAVITSPEIEQLSIPNENVPSSGKMIKGVWYYVYDLNKAKDEIYNFITAESSKEATK